MFIKKIILHFILLLSNVLKIGSNPRDSQCRKLPNGCRLEHLFDTKLKNDQFLYVCKQIDQSFVFSQNQMDQIVNCSSQIFDLNLKMVYFRLPSNQIFDDSFDFDNIATFLPNNIYIVRFRFIKGFDIDRFQVKSKNVSTAFTLEFFFSKFEFYSKKKSIGSCKDLTAFPQSIFQVYNYKIMFLSSSFKRSICPLLFRNCSVKILVFDGFINSFYKRNVLNFEQMIDNNTSDIGSNIIELNLYSFIKIDIESRIIDNLVFKNLGSLTLFGEISSIESGLFKNFKKLKNLYFYANYFQLLSHRRGIDWMFDLNSDYSIDLLNSTINTTELSEKCILIEFMPNFIKEFVTVESFFNLNTSYFEEEFPNEDFCLYKDFPFDHLLVVIPDSHGVNYNCAYLWFIQYYSIHNTFLDEFYQNITIITNLGELIEACNFNKM